MSKYMTGEDIEKIYREMELELISSMKRNLSRHLKEEQKVGFEFEQWQAATLKEFKRFQRENKSIIGNYTSSLDKDIQETFQNELKKGSKKEFSKYKKIMGDKFKENDNLRNSFFKLNDRKIKGLIKSTNNDLSTANKACFRMANDQFRKTVIKSVFFSNHGIVSPKKAIDIATKDFLTNGLKTIQYKDGRRVNIASYAKMTVRTGNKRAQLIGEGQFRKKIGEHLVQITSHGGTCKLCSKWEGKILIDDVYSGGSKKDGKYPLLSTAMDQGLFHPNCEHGLPTYYKELDEVYEEDNSTSHAIEEQYQTELNYINQNIYKYKRLETGSLDEENIKEYLVKRQQWEQLKDNLITIEEREQIKNYTGIDSQKINSSIRKGKITEEIQNKINLLDSAISKVLPLKEDKTIYRGTIPQSFEIFKGKARVTDKDMLSLKNTIQRDLAFLSTSSKAPETLGRNVIMTIKLPKGYKGALPIKRYAHEKFKYQEEVLLKRGNRFYINDVKIIDNKYYLEVEMKL